MAGGYAENDFATFNAAASPNVRGRRLIKRAVEESTSTVVTPDDWKLCLRDKDSNELYNLKDDPLEARNPYSDAQYASVVSRLSAEMYRWQETTNDKLKL